MINEIKSTRMRARGRWVKELEKEGVKLREGREELIADLQRFGRHN